jgi:hypothetical protein
MIQQQQRQVYLRKVLDKDIAVPRHRSSACRYFSSFLVFVCSLGHFVHDVRIKLDDDEVTLNFYQMKRSMKSLIAYEDEILPALTDAFGVLFKQIQHELTSATRHELETDAHFLNIFLIIFQLPYLSDPGFLFETATIFYSLLAKLSIEAQTKFVRVLAKYKHELGAYVAHVQQYITMHTVKWADRMQINDTNETLLSNERGTRVGRCRRTSNADLA